MHVVIFVMMFLLKILSFLGILNNSRVVIKNVDWNKRKKLQRKRSV